MLRKFITVVGLTAVVVVAAGPSVAAASVTVSATATFHGAIEDPEPSDPRVSYCGGSGQPGCAGGEPVQLNWGKPTTNQSRLGFTPASTATVGQPFVLGFLSHHNKTNSYGSGIVGVKLDVIAHIADGARRLYFSDPITMGLGISEVGDADPVCPHDRIGGKCADAIVLPFPRDAFVHQVGNVTYRYEVLGFVTDGGQVQQKMATAEGRVTERALLGVVTKESNVVADAGVDQIVDEGTSAVLDGTRSRVSDLTYRWEQLSGPRVVLDDPSAVRPRFPVGMFTEDQDLVFRLTVADRLEPGYTSSDAVVIRVRDLNDPPVADAGGPYTVPEGDQVRLGGVATDPDDNIATVRWDLDGDGAFDDATGTSPSFSAVGLDGPSVVSIAMEVCDTSGVCATDIARVDVTNVAPVVDVGRDLTVWRYDLIDLLGRFSDPAGALDDRYGFGWSDGPSGTAAYGSELRHQQSYALEGVYTIDLDVADKDGGTGRDSLRVTVLNKDPRCLTGRPTIPVLLARNHGFIEVGITGLTDPEGDPLAVTMTGIRQDEPVRGPGAGTTAPDGTGIGTSTAKLRAERLGSGDGRVYHLTYTVDDGHGGSCGGTVMVGVKHDSSDREPVDQGPLYDSTVA